MLETTGGEKESVNFWQVIDENYKVPNPEDWTLSTSADSIPDKIELDEFHYHEMLDRLHLINSTINDYLLEHPVASKHKRLYNKIEKALDLLAEAYQMTGNLGFKSDKPIYTQKQVDAMLTKAGVLTGKDAKIFFDNVVNPKALTPEIRERMFKNYNNIKDKFNIEIKDE